MEGTNVLFSSNIKYKTDGVTPEQTQIIMDETKRLKTLVNDVLDIAKLESGIQGLNLSNYSLTKSVKATTERIAELVKKNGYCFSFIQDKEVFIKRFLQNKFEFLSHPYILIEFHIIDLNQCLYI